MPTNALSSSSCRTRPAYESWPTGLRASGGALRSLKSKLVAYVETQRGRTLRTALRKPAIEVRKE